MATEREILVGLLEEGLLLGEHELGLMKLDNPLDVLIGAMYPGLPIPLDLMVRALVEDPEMPEARGEIIRICTPDGGAFEDTGG